jgi:hypothetical protein
MGGMNPKARHTAYVLTPADTITDEQIQALRFEAADHGDDLMAEICTKALTGRSTIALNLTQYGCRIRCAHAIVNANAAGAEPKEAPEPSRASRSDCDRSFGF